MRIAAALGTCLGAAAQDAEPAPDPPAGPQLFGEAPLETRTLTGDWFGQGDTLREAGVTLTLDFWAIYQQNTSGGISPEGGGLGQYRLASEFDLGKLAGLDGASVYLRVDGGWIDSIDDGVGELMPINGEFFEDSGIVLTNLWYEQQLFDGRLSFRIGKLDISWGMNFHGQTVAFDCNQYANYGGTQFLNSGLINNATIPFPDYGLGALVLAEPVDRVYVAAGLSNANAAGSTSGFTGVFKWIVLAEAGVAAELHAGETTLPGLYSVGYWHSQFEDAPTGWGVYFDMDQLVLSEGGDDDQGLGVFARYGWADDSPLGVRNFWSAGGQYTGLVPGRDEDVLGLGWAQAFTGGDPEFSRPYEAVLETYYRAPITPWLVVSPMLQFIVNPGSTDTPDALVFTLRGQVVF